MQTIFDCKFVKLVINMLNVKGTLNNVDPQRNTSCKFVFSVYCSPRRDSIHNFQYNILYNIYTHTHTFLNNDFLKSTLMSKARKSHSLWTAWELLKTKLCTLLCKKGNWKGRKGSVIKRANKYMKFPKYKRLVVLQCYPSEDGISLQVEPEGRKYVTGKMQTAYQEGKKGN